MKPQFIYLDGDEERQQLIEQIHAVREEVISIAQRVPEPEQFAPRYRGRSLAVMLARLVVYDTATLWLIRAASNGYAVRVSPRLIHTADRIISWFSQRRIISSSIGAIRRKETEITQFVEKVPLEVLSRDVIYPGKKSPYTVEKALQVCFLHHWQRELALMQQADSVGKV